MNVTNVQSTAAHLLAPQETSRVAFLLSLRQVDLDPVLSKLQNQLEQGKIKVGTSAGELYNEKFITYRSSVFLEHSLICFEASNLDE